MVTVDGAHTTLGGVDAHAAEEVGNLLSLVTQTIGLVG